jgi:hypothetical protein
VRRWASAHPVPWQEFPFGKRLSKLDDGGLSELLEHGFEPAEIAHKLVEGALRLGGGGDLMR